MNDQLNQLLTANKERGPHSQFLQDAFDILMSEEEDLIPYVSDFQINYRYQSSIGSYNNENHIISINIMNLYDYHYEPRVRNRKILALQVLKHELEHAKQLRNLYEPQQDMETKVIHASLRGYALKNGLIANVQNSNNDIKSIKELKCENYDLDPCERLAEIKAWKFILNLLKQSKNRVDWEIAHEMLKSVYQKGYIEKNQFAPTYQFLLNLRLYEEYESIKKITGSRKYNYNSRIHFGLPITNQEVKSKLKINTKK